jgi:ABC-type multidrug transport system permease subunit
MGLLTLLVFGLGLEQGNVPWLWIAFLCALISGVFIQLFISRKNSRRRQ